MEYQFDTFPDPPIARTPVTSPVDGSGTFGVRGGSGVVLDDGRVLHIWTEWFQTATFHQWWIQLGYASSVDTYLGQNDSVTKDRTLLYMSCDLTIDGFDPSTGGFDVGIVTAGVNRGPDGDLWLGFCGGGFAGNEVWDASVTTTTYGGYWQGCLKSTDEGDNWTFIDDMLAVSAGSVKQRVGSSAGNLGTFGQIDVVPAGFTRAGRWLWSCTTRGTFTNTPATSSLNPAIFYSDDDGATWSESLQPTDSDRTQMSSGVAFGVDGNIYAKQSEDNQSGKTTRWYRTDDSDITTWSPAYDTYTYPATPDYELVRTGPWFTLTGDTNRVYTMQFTGSDTDNGLDPVIFYVDVVDYPTPDQRTDYQTYWAPTVTNLATNGDEIYLGVLQEDTWAGVWIGNQVFGVRLVVCPILPELHIPYKDWAVVEDQMERRQQALENLLTIRRWADAAVRAGATTELLVMPAVATGRLPVDGLVGDAFTQTWLAIERWARGTCTDETLHVPYKERIDRDRDNLLRLERWARSYL